MWKKYLAENGLESEIHPINKLLTHYQGIERYLHNSYEPNQQLTEKVEKYLNEHDQLNIEQLYSIIHELSIFCVSFYAKTPSKELGFCDFWQPAMQPFEEFISQCGLLRIEHSAKPIIKPLIIINRLKKEKNYAFMAQATLQ
ncbi:hypothetical protein [Motilimonas eburnea]|uniref:hypothetical protein n=1 Tax=Motilimonas eburnea TaxID=1737488 RepID=UPI001E4C09EB|nr:hypothetical protein [Motilimonas eburnea]MCE2572812.1 hypothetical protein [Motilimonas eburnea]